MPGMATKSRPARDWNVDMFLSSEAAGRIARRDIGAERRKAYLLADGTRLIPSGAST